MKLKKVMKPFQGTPEYCKGLFEESNISDINELDLKKFSDRIPIINSQGFKVGEISKNRLLNLIRTYDNDLMLEILDHLDDGIIAADQNGIVFYANNMYSKIFGIPTGKVLGRSIYDTEPNAALITVLENKKPITLDKKYVHTINKFVSCKISPIFIKDIFRGAISVFRDVSEIIALNQQVRDAELLAKNLQHHLNTITSAEQLTIIGSSPEIKEIISRAAIAAKTDVPILIRGENGTGKEVLAKYIHNNSNRADMPLVTVNCSSIPENLIESELFGYEEGSFTGSKKGGKIGKFEMANGGTLFLDEIGDMSLSLQTKLLRAIQNKEIEKIGREKKYLVDVRIISATNKPLESMIENQLFRIDFYYRINTVTLRIPPLRERKEDIALFAYYFINRFNEKYNKNVTFSPEVLSWFYRYNWPGNIREMENCIENGVIMSQDNIFNLMHLSQHMVDTAIADDDIHAFSAKPNIIKHTLANEREKAERESIRIALEACSGNRTEAMKMLGLSRRTFYRKLQYYGFTKKHLP